MLRILIAAVSIAILGYPCYAEAKEPRKPSGVKVHMCESVDVYTGAVDASHPATRIAESCRDVSPATAQKAIDRCAAKGPEVCEVLYTADRKTLLIESKIVVSTAAATVARGGK
jgi:hypothetical protein